mgnify:CR=1 FL=1
MGREDIRGLLYEVRATQKVHEPEVPQRIYRAKKGYIFVFHIYNLLKTTQTLNVF